MAKTTAKSGNKAKGNKTQPTFADLDAWIATLDDKRRGDAKTLTAMMRNATGDRGCLWGSSMAGFGSYHYTYASGREGDYFEVGFAPRKAKLVVYLMPGYSNFEAQLARLGKHSIGKSCLYLNKLADVDLQVLEDMVVQAVKDVREKWG